MFSSYIYQMLINVNAETNVYVQNGNTFYLSHEISPFCAIERIHPLNQHFLELFIVNYFRFESKVLNKQKGQEKMNKWIQNVYKKSVLRVAIMLFILTNFKFDCNINFVIIDWRLREFLRRHSFLLFLKSQLLLLLIVNIPFIWRISFSPTFFFCIICSFFVLFFNCFLMTLIWLRAGHTELLSIYRI